MNINRDYVSKENTYAGQNVPWYIVIHETDNRSKGSGAKKHAQAQMAGHLDTSVQYYAGSDGVYQAAEITDGTYSIGREYGGNHAITDANNRNTINIEICVNADGDYNIARANAIELVKYLIQSTGIPAERVIRHYDAKGKYCPRNMMDNPALWEDFKLQVGDIKKQEAVLPQDHERWYRVGSDWINGICQGQTGAYHNLEYAIADCGEGQKVYNEYGSIVYHGGTSKVIDSSSYTQNQFVRDVQRATESVVDGIPGDETISNTVTVSKVKNKNHAVVTPLERRLKALGYYNGAIEADEGKTPCFGNGMEAAVNAYQIGVLGYDKADGEITARKRMWRSLLGME